ncbi:SGNH/GDSL hydrolase family protein [Williamsia herbipolensis]|uniref:SGNH/GDSL hydrolase family protein n=1 Tax=Williamsia herbipolensis TaxID=1603258 RepID=A0AAU4K761_9NOCA|nr:SGNH/GDSL hydrolase family protein [Williamsia herbipolensis]
MGAPFASLSAAQIEELTDPWAGQVHALAFGDSYFTGSDGVRRSQTFGRIALNGLGYTVTQSGHGGTGYVVESRVDGWPNFVSQLSDSALGELPVPPISVVLLEGGVNDALSNVPAALIRTNAAWVMASLRDRYPLAKHVVLGVPPDRAGRLTGPRAAINVAIRDAALATRWTFVDMRQLITPTTASMIIGPDRLHPTVEGHQKLAALLSAQLAKVGVAPVMPPR